ncbi:MAG: hypothetical protein HUJ26_04480 [Planctomycetaceae bacterium]|nr:hypothetical protein [Planctomycetaceae bacterium]
MTKHFVPDRSNRPESSEGQFGTVREIRSEKESASELADGRPVVFEMALVDGYDCRFCYFSAVGLEDATFDELTELLNSSGISWPDEIDDGKVYAEAKRIKDAQDRDCWEFQLTFPRLG